MAGPADPLINFRHEETTLSRFTHSKKHLIFLFLLLLPFIVTNSYGLKSGKLKGVYHRVKRGETLYSIARAYHVHVQDLAEVNNVENPNRIEFDRVIFVPDATEVVEDVMLLLRAREAASGRSNPAVEEVLVSKPPPVRDSPSVREKLSESENNVTSESNPRKMPDQPSGNTVEEASETSKVPIASTGRDALSANESSPPPLPTPAKSSDGSLNKEAPQIDVSGKVQFERKRFVWPVKGRVISRFGVQPNGMYYNWISISAKDMTPVVAAASGTVIFSAELKDYGETIIIKHADNFATVYTHLKTRKALFDNPVRKGESIATVGRLGKEDNVYLNFEVRHQNRARNPLFFLP